MASQPNYKGLELEIRLKIKEMQALDKTRNDYFDRYTKKLGEIEKLKRRKEEEERKSFHEINKKVEADRRARKIPTQEQIQKEIDRKDFVFVICVGCIILFLVWLFLY